MNETIALAASKAEGDLRPEQLQTMYVEMLRIREAEERLANLVTAGAVKCPCHLCSGQEAVAVGACSALQPSDYVFGNHRSHGHYLAKGGSMKGLFAEVYGKKQVARAAEAARCT